MARIGQLRRAVAPTAVILVIASSACTHARPRTETMPTGGLSGDVRLLPREGADTALGPVVVIAEAVEPADAGRRSPQRVHVSSEGERFDPGFAVVAAGDSVVFVNRGALTHRLFSAELGRDVFVPLAPEAPSAPLPLRRRGEVRFFCSLHPEETFDLLVTTSAPFDVTDENGWYDIGPLPDGRYRLSVWTRRVSGPVRVVEVAAGRLSIEPIRLDPDLIPR